MTLPELLDLVRAYGDETDVSVWRRLRLTLRRARPAARRRRRAGRVPGDGPGRRRPALRRVGLHGADGDDDRTRELRGVLLAVAAVYGADPDAVAEARRVRAAGIADPSSVDPPLFAGVATIVVAETGGAEDFETALARYRSAATPQEEVRELYNLARFHDPELIDRLCELA